MSGYKPYPKYKDSGVEWLGHIPENWEMKRLKYLLDEPMQYGAIEASDNAVESDPRYIRITDIDDSGGLRDDTFRSLPPETAEPYLLKNGDLLFARSGATVGKTFLYLSKFGPCAYAGYLIRARLSREKAIPEIIKYHTLTRTYTQWIGSETIQATIQNVNAEKYGNFPLPIPLLPEQNSIAAFLDRETGKLDLLIREQKELIALLQEKRQALISNAVTKGLNPKAKMKDSGVEWLGEVPEHWQVKRLKQIAHVRGGVAKGRDLTGQPTVLVPYLRVANVQDGYLNLDEVSEIEIGVDEKNRYDLRVGDVLMNEGGGILISLGGAASGMAKLVLACTKITFFP